MQKNFYQEKTSTITTLIEYNENFLSEKKILDKKEIESIDFKDSKNNYWLTVTGLQDSKKINEISRIFGIHSLVIEDILNKQQRPKFEEYNNYFFIVLNSIEYNKEKHRVQTKKVNIILFENIIITFLEQPVNCLEKLKEKIRKGNNTIRKNSTDYLCYSIIDSIVDNYFYSFEVLGEIIDKLEREIIGNPTEKTIQKIYKLKKEMLFLRKTVWPIREITSLMQNQPKEKIKTKTKIYLRDLYDHIIQLIDTLEIYRETLSVTLDIYLSSQNNKMNEIMKMLTIIATIFIPLTFITGIYGMNFQYMPELKIKIAYPLVLLLMLLIALSMLLYFKKKKWL